MFELTLLQHRMDDLSVFQLREVLQKGCLKANQLFLISLWNNLHWTHRNHAHMMI